MSGGKSRRGLNLTISNAHPLQRVGVFSIPPRLPDRAARLCLSGSYLTPPAGREYVLPRVQDGPQGSPYPRILALPCRERIRMPPLMVTGGCGFIGSNFIRHLLETDPAVSVINFDALTYAGNLANLADLAGHPRYSFVRGDVADRTAVRKVVEKGVSGIIHFAAESHVDR